MAKKISGKTQWRINHLIGVVLILVIFCGIQFVNYKQYYRKDIASSDYLELSEMTVNMVKNLPDQVKITTFISPQPDQLGGIAAPDVQQLLDRYRYASKGKIELKTVDPFLDFDQAKAVADKFKLNSNENVVVIQYGERSTVLKLSDMVELDRGDGMGDAPKVTAFKGEQELTSAIQALVLGKKAKVYFVTGHGEYDPKAEPAMRAGYSLLTAYVERQNVEVLKLNLLEKMAVPDDADLLVIGGPQQRFSDTEIGILKNYLKKTGAPAPRLILMLDPDTVTGLENFLEPYGVTFDNDLVVAALYSGALTDEAVGQVFAEHPVTNWARMGGIQISFDRARSLTVKQVPGGPENVVKLVQTPNIYWGETDLKNLAAAFDVSKDLTGPLTLAVAIDSGTLPGGEVKVDGPQIIAMGSANFMVNQKQKSPDFFLNAMNWMLGKRDSLGISPKQPKDFKVALTERDRQILTSIVFLIIPGVITVIGVLVWLRRRK